MTDDLDQLSVDTIRTLTMDAIEKAANGHPGMPMGMAPAAFVLFTRHMDHNPKDPHWPDRDRFVLSAGHGSMLLYSVLHLTGYELSMDELKNFREMGSLTPGHPERDLVHVTPGVEITTGPLGQGFANGVGMAMAERFLREKFGEEVVDHHVYAIVSDGDLMEGIASEAASLAGQLGLERLVYLYDDNSISLDGPTSLSFDSEDVTKRFEAYGWHVLEVHDANDLTALDAAISAGRDEKGKPTLIRVKSIIGYPAPNKQNTKAAHGSALGADEVRATKEVMGWDPDAQFVVPDGVYEHFSMVEKGAAAQEAWQERMDAWREQDADAAAAWDAGLEGRPLPGIDEALAPGAIDWGKDEIATRSAGKAVMKAFAPFVPTMVGGAADLSSSTNTEFPGGDDERYTRAKAGRNVFYGVREHGMGGVVNGMAGHGGITRPYGSTFLQFSDYMRGSVRLSALMQLPVAWVYTHDSVALGADGPTHQPVEHLASLRAIPGLTVLRPADATETAELWRLVLTEFEGPALFALSRQDLPILQDLDVAGIGKGAYVVRAGDGPVIVGTGAELHTALEAADLLAEDGVDAQVVSMPSWELFEEQDESYQREIFPPDRVKVSVEAAVTFGWARWVDASVGVDRFGISAPGPEVLAELGITGEHVAEVVREASA